jgi:magnesium chelatase family protein
VKHSIIKSVVVIGVSGHLIDVEVDIGEGLPGFSIVGLPDTAVAEARDRVKAAVRNSGLIWPNRKVTVSLSPAGLPKNGAGIDLAIAVAVLVATKQLNIKDFENFAVLGELGLDGKVKAVRGALPAAIAASESLGNFLTADGCAAQCTLVENLNVVAVSSLKELVEVFKGIVEA